jgi:hypothetical protein
MFLLILLSLQAFAQPNNFCPRLEGAFQNCTVGSTARGVDLKQIGLEIPKTIVVKSHFYRGELSYTVNDTGDIAIDPTNPSTLLDLIRPYSPPQHINIYKDGIRGMTTYSYCDGKKLHHRISTQIESRVQLKDNPINIETSFEIDDQNGDLLAEMFAPRDISEVNSTNNWPFVVSFRCQKQN